MADETIGGGVDSKHPDFLEREPEWQLMHDTARGEDAVKAAESTYLPIPSGFAASSDPTGMYDAYKTRAEVPEIVGPTVSGMVGVIHRKEAQIEMPEAMQGLWEKATRDGLPLEALHRRITGEVLEVGRYSLLVDAASDGSDLPWLAGYRAERLINWSDRRDFFVLDETELERTGFDWAAVNRYRVLELVDGVYTVSIWEDGEPEIIIHRDGSKEEIIPLVPVDNVTPERRGGGALDEIPFVVIGPKDLAVPPETPPLIGVARSTVSSYQLSADYRWQLFMSGQETFIVINADAPDAVGAGVCVSLKGEPGVDVDAKYVGPDGVGIDAHRQAIQDKRADAIAAGARMFDSQEKAAESGEALKIRYAAQTATLVSVAQASAAGLEQALKHVAVMIGANPDDVVVTPDLSFLQSVMNPQDAKNLMELWTGGAISYETLYENLQRGQIASSERDAEEELELIDEEDAEPEDQGFVQPIDPNAPPVDPSNPPGGSQ